MTSVGGGHSERARRVAIVGFGPKGFGCLERLALSVARADDPAPLEVSIHDPAEHPGAGPVYDPSQPHHLLLNFAAGNVDVWSPDNDLVSPGQRADLVSWLARVHPEWADPAAFVPRALVGAYLRDAYASLAAHLPRSLRVQHVRGSVTAVTSERGAWRLSHDDPALDRDGVDEVMLTLGHGRWTGAPAGSRGWTEGLPPRGRTRLVTSVFPVTERLAVAAVPAGAQVGVRGFALTWIDAALALTAGRGGRFAALDTDAPRYLGAPDEVARIVPFSRTGLPLMAKPERWLPARSRGLKVVWDRLRADIMVLSPTSPAPADAAAPVVAEEPGHDPIDEPVDGLAGLLAAAATRALGAAASCTTEDPVSEVTAVLVPPMAAAADTGWGQTAGHAALEAMRRSVAIAQGRRPVDATWAVGEAWRQAYPALVALVGHGGLPLASRPAFRDLARSMERLAFGPPADNVARMIALADAGRLDLSWVASPRIESHDGALALVGGAGRATLDVLVDAVIAPPGAAPPDGPTAALVTGGHARIAAGGRGLEVTPAARCVGADGSVTPGLAAIGRVTEDWVLGNDTLSRRLHPEAAAWADDVVRGGAGASGRCGIGADVSVRA